MRSVCQDFIQRRWLEAKLTQASQLRCDTADAVAQGRVATSQERQKAPQTAFISDLTGLFIDEAPTDFDSVLTVTVVDDPIPNALYCDQPQLRQILFNLLSSDQVHFRANPRS